jgi:hypothetical protein
MSMIELTYLNTLVLIIAGMVHGALLYGVVRELRELRRREG